MGATFNLSDQWTLPINLTSAQRLPTAEELLSNLSGSDELIPHLATSTIEIGNIELDQETANNFDIGLRYRNNSFSFNFALFYNQIDDYVFLEDSGQESAGIPIFNYQQKDATFKGFEADISYQVTDSSSDIWNYRLFTDSTKAELSNGDNLPRIPANRIGFDIGWLRGNWAVNLDYTHVSKQTKLAEFELPTNSYNDVSISANWVFTGPRTENLLFVKINNLLNEEIREHASFIKDISPRPSRSLISGIRISF